MNKLMIKRLIVKSNKKIAIRSILYTFVFIGFSFAYFLFMSFTDNKEISYDYSKFMEKAISREQYLERVSDSLETKYGILVNNLDELYDLNWDNVYFWLCYYGVRNKEAVMCKIYVETGNLSSKLCVKYGNLIGMHWPEKRPHTAKSWVIADRGSKVSVYDHWWLSLKDYKMWQDYFGYNDEVSFDDYLILTKVHGYSETVTYINTLYKVKDKIISKFLKERLNDVERVALCKL